jgi:signal transduction histidine kinase/ActR/RegA family two-component response regulator
MKSKRWMLLSVILTMIISMICFPVTAVHAETAQTITVGMLEYAGYATQNEDGTYSGYNVEFAYKIAQYANFNINIVLFKTGKEELDALDNGTVDALCNVFKTDDREEKYLFSEREVGNLSMCVFCKEGDSRFSYGNTSQLGSITVGAEAGTKVKDNFLAWAELQEISPVIKEYNNLSEIEQAINDGEIDAGIYGAPSVDGYQVLSRFAPQPYYFVYQKSKTSLKRLIDNAMDKILTEDPLYRNELYDKYIKSLETEMEPLTTKEKNFIVSKQTVNVAVLKSDAPYYTKDSSGNPQGIIPDFYKKLAELTGFSFVYKEYGSEEDAVTAVLNGESDVLAMYSDGQISAYNKRLRITSAYAKVDAVLVAHTGDTINDISTIAAKKRSISAMQTVFLGETGKNWVAYNSAADCFNALKNNEVDAIICGQPSANWLINQNNVSAYSLTTVSSGSIAISGALAYNNDVLCSILSKAVTVASLSFDEIATKNTLPDSNLKAAIARLSPGVLLFITAVLVALVIFLFWSMNVILRHQKEKNIILQQKAENDRRQIELAAAEKQTEDKNRFFANISHDMRTPLNAIIGFSDIAAEDAVAPRTKDYLEKIKASGQLLNELINDTLTISKVNSGKMVLQEKPTNTNEIFDAIYYPIQAMAFRKEITFTMDRSQCSDRRIVVDALNLEKILLNLLTNAVKYTPEGGKVVFSAKIIQDGSPCPETVFVVQDNGIGISPEFLPRIYEPFVQEENTGAQSAGTGLGLSIVKNLVDMMNGTIEVESVKNEGTKFTVHFHFAVAEKEPEEKKEVNDTVDLTGRHVLLCEDNQLNREIAMELLKRKGMLVDTAENGEEGLEKFIQSEDGYYDVILMDIRMPVMNGLEAAKAIRKLARKDAGTVPILSMTANAFEDDIQECLDAGMNAHIAKPIEPEVMFHTIEKALKQN